MEPEVKHDEKKSIFYIELDGEIAYLDYAMRGNKIDLYHTYTPTQLRGKGLAGKIVEFAFNYAKENNLKVIPSCPFIPSFLAKNPEYKKFVTD
jgi:predicted GNAT family acetyltransferase